MKGFNTKLLLVSALVLASSGLQAKTYKFATNIPSKDAAGTLLTELGDNIKNRTEGRVKIRFFWNGTLGGQAQYLQQVQSGVIDLGLVNSATLENLAPEITGVNLPYVFRSLEEYEDTMLNPEVAKIIEDSVAAKKVYPMGFLSNGFRSIYTTKPTSSLEELEGLKLRTSPSDTYMTLIRALGGVPTPMDFGEVYPALQQGIIDGAEGGLAGLWEVKFGEVSKYALRTEHTRLTDFLIASEKFTTSVSADDMVIVKAEFLKTTKKSFGAVAAQIEKSEALAESELGVQYTEIDKVPLIKRMQPMYDDALSNPVKKELLETIFRIQGR
ncbi:TRAP transporter substrate-binding protein DctP [Vibrio sp. DW001]|uniref:TRAP transporter substrate-binding protein DctP n=1 Tax=Vibrio sp. DW001 TaxID=2912315 RepID=UPI0023B0304E|nr:TRAP transporter substrate-binding protein DctP [Vibrio sp. DW001]WED29775.1 TRAP transporter substrate-binding protein DctP [Vibrio sp. DW001]